MEKHLLCEAMMREKKGLHILTPTLTDVNTTRKELKGLGPFVAVFVLAAEGGRMVSDDMELLQMFRKRDNCVVIVFNTKRSPEFEDLIKKQLDHSPSHIYFVPRANDSTKIFRAIVDDMCKWTARPYEPFFTLQEERKALEAAQQQLFLEQEAECKRQEVIRQDLIRQQQEAEAALAVERAKVEAAELAFSRSCSTGARTLAEHYRLVKEAANRVGFLKMKSNCRVFFSRCSHAGRTLPFGATGCEACRLLNTQFYVMTRKQFG